MRRILMRYKILYQTKSTFRYIYSNYYVIGTGGQEILQRILED